MSVQSDAEIKRLQRRGQLQGYTLEPDYGGPETILERTNEFIQNIPNLLTLGGIPKANPYGRMSPEERRDYDATRFANVQEARQNVLEEELEKEKAKQKEAEQESYQQKIARFKAESALETENLLKTLGDVNRMQTDQIVEARKQLMPLETQQTVEQLRTALPYIDEAAARGLARNLMASKDFLAFKERQPSMQQKIAASQQEQMSSASRAFGEEARAIAAQLDAATRFGEIGSSPRATIYQGMKPAAFK